MADTVTQAPAAVPGDLVPSGWSLAVRQLQFWLTNYRRTWRGSIYSSVLNPLLFLGAMGLGLGSLVNQHGTARLGGVSYLAFLAPGLLAAAAMETGVGEATYPVYGSVKWNKTYQAAVASPLSPADIFHGHVLFVTLRLAMNCAVFLAVASAFGAIRSPWMLAALPVAVLTGLAFATPIEAWAVTRTRDSSFAMIFRFGMIPLFLFSGHVLPGHAASGLVPAGRLPHAALARCLALPCAQPGHGGLGAGAHRRGLPRRARHDRDTGRAPQLPAAALCLAACPAAGTCGCGSCRCGWSRWPGFPPACAGHSAGGAACT
jgi:lipooligosaccharide transport system permease protein